MAIHMPSRTMTTLEWLEQKGCKTKRVYSRKAAAKEICKQARKRTGKKFYPYECQYCGQWHISKNRPKGKSDE